MQILSKVKRRYFRSRQKLHLLKHLEKPTYIHHLAHFSFHKNIAIGKYCRIGRECHLDGEGGISIGPGTILAPRVVLLTSTHNYRQDTLLPYDPEDHKKPIHIGKGCWIGWGAFIVPGVTIGDGAVIAMGAVVTRDVEKGAIVGGNPAKVIRRRDNPSFIDTAISNEQYFIRHKIENNVVRSGRVNNNQVDLIT